MDEVDLPEGEEAKVFGMMFAPPGYNIDTMPDVYREIDGVFSPSFGADPEDFAEGRSKYTEKKMAKAFKKMLAEHGQESLLQLTHFYGSRN